MNALAQEYQADEVVVSIGHPQPRTFVEILRKKLKGIGEIEMAQEGLDRDYIELCKRILRAQKVDWTFLEALGQPGERVVLDLPDYVAIFIPIELYEPQPINVAFHPTGEGDVEIGILNEEERAIFRCMANVAVEADRFSFQGQLIPDLSEDQVLRVTLMYWVLLWCSIVWRFPEIQEVLDDSSLSLEVREGWKAVACRSG